MNRFQTLGLVLAGLLLADVPPAGASLTLSSYSGDLAPGNWTAQNFSGAPGSYAFTSSKTLQISDSADTIASDIRLTSIALTQVTSISFDWSVTANGGGGVAAYYYLNSTLFDLTGSSGVINLNNVAAGTTISFELASSSTASGKEPALLEVDVVPEAGTWLAAVFLLGVVGYEFRRRRLCAPANPAA